MINPVPTPETELLAKSVAAYLPMTLVRTILQDNMPTPTHPNSLFAATIFADISGFTQMSEELASDGTRGAEELNRVLLVTFTAMLDVIHEMGGAVSHFYGDAMAVYFPDGDNTAAFRALTCAQMMQRLMLSSFGKARTNRPPGKPAVFDLTIKIGVGYGRCQEIVVGQVNQNMEFVLTGTAVDEAVEAEKQATAGEIIASRQVLEKNGISISEPFKKYEADLQQAKPQPIVDWKAYSSDAYERLIDAAVPFVPKAIVQRLQESGVAEIAEHRPVTSIFVQFQFKNDEDDSSAIESITMGQQLQSYYQWAVAIVRRFGAENGRVNRVLTGDKGNQLHIMFGAPVAPDAPEQALRCGMALLREQPDFVAFQKIGVAVGKVFAGPVGSTARREYTVVGDVVNLSARLMQICPNGELITNRTTADRTRQWIEFESLPPQQLKGKQQSVVPHRMVADRSASTQIQSYIERWDRPLFGRDTEIEKLTEWLDLALAGEGGILALTGSTGTGKSRLLSYAINHWLSKGGMGLLGICLQHTSDIPYTPWRAIWRDFFGLLGGMTIQEQVASVVEQVAILAPNEADDVGLWAEPLGLPIPQSERLTVLTAEARQARFFALVKRCFQTAVSRQPIFIILEGLQYADSSSVALLDALTTDINELALYVGISYRPEREFELKLSSHPSCQQIQLSDLSPEHARQILVQLVGTDSLPPLIEQQLGLRDREGRDSPVNPLFLEESLNVMLQSGVIEQNGALHVHEELLNEIQLPDTIHGLLLARLDRLPPSERDLLQLASVIGRQFEVDSLRALTQVPHQTPIIEMLTDLTEADMTHLVTADPEWVYLFQHAMTHEVAYESLPYAKRQNLHAQVADWLVRTKAENLRPFFPILAFHFSRAGQNEEAVDYSIKAAADAKALFANQESVDFYNLAEKHLQIFGIEERWETAVEIMLARAESLRFIGNFEAAVTDAESSEKLLQGKSDQSKYPSVLNLIAELKCRQGDFENGKSFAYKVITLLDENQESPELARAYQWFGYAEAVLGNFDSALQNLEVARIICSKLDDKVRMALVLETIAFVNYQQKNLNLALDAMLESVEMSKDFNVPANIAASYINVSLIQFQIGQPEAALQSVNQAIEFAQTTSRNFLARAYSNKAEILTYLGLYNEALDTFELSMNLFTVMEDNQGLLEVFLLFGFEYHLSKEEFDEALVYFEKAEKIIEQLSALHSEGEARYLIGKGAVYLAQGEPECLGVLEKAAEIIEKQNYSWWKPAVNYLLGQLHIQLGKKNMAMGLFNVALESAHADGCPDYLPLIYQSIALIESNEHQATEYLMLSARHAIDRAKFYDKKNTLKAVQERLRANEDETAVKALLIEIEAHLIKLNAVNEKTPREVSF
ncbi:MAG: AAA family ATPase [Chloroflexota bacterium]